MRGICSLVSFLALGLATVTANFTLIQEYSGSTFFDKWDFAADLGQYYDNTTSGDVFWLGKANSSNLAYVDSTTGHAIIKIDNTTFVPYNDKRNSIRITSQDYFDYGTIWVFDAYHLPWGCGIWPGLWTKGNDWPNNGEIDIVEGVNRMTYNQMALHTVTGCTVTNGTDQIGTTTVTDCSPASGCTVTENQPNSYGPAFATNGGGVWAAQFDISGIFIWFWPRNNVPASITTAVDSIDISAWGPPSAAYPSDNCNIATFFGWQQLVIDITMCGTWAGIPSVYAATCDNTPFHPEANITQRCTIDNVYYNGTTDLATAYFELGSIRAFAFTNSSSSGTTSNSTQTSSNPNQTPTDGGSDNGNGGGPGTSRGESQFIASRDTYFLVGISTLFSWVLI